MTPPTRLVVMLARLLQRIRLRQPQPATTPPLAVTLPHQGMATAAVVVVVVAMTTLLLTPHRHLRLCLCHHRLHRLPQLTMLAPQLPMLAPQLTTLQRLPPAPSKLHPRPRRPLRVRAAPQHGSEPPAWAAEAAAPPLAATAKP